MTNKRTYDKISKHDCNINKRNNERNDGRKAKIYAIKPYTLEETLRCLNEAVIDATCINRLVNKIGELFLDAATLISNNKSVDPLKKNNRL